MHVQVAGAFVLFVCLLLPSLPATGSLMLQPPLQDLIADYRERLAVDQYALPPCEFDVEDASEISFDRFWKLYVESGTPVLFANVTRGWRARESWSAQSWASRFGNLSFPKSREDAVLDADNSALGNGLESGSRWFFQWKFGIYSDLWPKLKDDIAWDQIELFTRISFYPVLSIGSNGSYNQMHRHRQAWQAQVHGLKLWWMAKTTKDVQEQVNFSQGHSDPFLHWDLNICSLFSQRPVQNSHYCVVPPGFGIFVPYDHFHGTCNLDSWTVSYGGEGGEMGTIQPKLQAIMFDDMDRYDVEPASNYGRYALDIAVKSGHTRMVEQILSDLGDSKGDRKAALQSAVDNGQANILSKLLERTNAWDPHPCSLCNVVTQIWHAERILPILADHFGQSIHSCCPAMYDFTPLHSAAGRKTNDLGTLKFLLARRADLHTRMMGAFDLARKDRRPRSKLFDPSSCTGSLPIHHAAAQGHISVLKYLHKHGVDLHAKTYQDHTAFFVSVLNGHLPAAEFFLHHRADVSVRAGALDSWEPIHVAAARGSIPLLDMLLKHGADPTIKSKRGIPPSQFCEDKRARDYLDSVLANSHISQSQQAAHEAREL